MWYDAEELRGATEALEFILHFFPECLVMRKTNPIVF